LQHHQKIKEENNVLLKENTRLSSENKKLLRELGKGRSSPAIFDDTQNLSFSTSNLGVMLPEEPDVMNMSIVSKLHEVLGDLDNKENHNNLNSTSFQ